MKFSNLLRRSLAMLLLLAMLVTLVPNVFAAEETGDIDNIVIDVPDHLKDEDVVTASFGEDGKITYDYASDEVRAVINAGGMTTSAITDSSGTTILENRGNPAMAKQQRLAFFIDPSNSEGTSNYSTFSLTAARVQNLVAAGVTDLFVMTKNRAGSFSLTDLKTANSNKGSAKVYAWMHCARDDAYLASNKNSAQYHFRAGYNNDQNGGDTSVTGYVHLANSGYVTYMKGLMDQANDYADGLLLDSLIFGSEYMGWDADARTYMGKTYYNEAVKAMCARAYEQYGSTYRYKADDNGYYAYVASGGSTNTSGSTLSEISSTDAGKKFRDYRRSVINTFVKEMRSAFGTSKIIAVALERDYSNNFFNHTVRGLYPYAFRSYINNGFVVTMQVGANHTTNPVTLAKTMAKYTNVMVGVDFYQVGTVGTYGYTYPDTVTDLAESIFTARYQVAGDYATYRGYILGAACYTMGHVGAVKVSLSGSGSTPTMTATVANPNKKTVAMLTYFNKHGDSDCTPNTSYGEDTVESGTMHYYAQSGYVTSYSPLTNYSVSAFGATTLQVKLKNYTVDWDKLPFIRFGFYPIYDFDSYANTVAHFPIYIIANHASCTSFTTTWISAAATCTTKGFKKHVCKTCSYTYIEEVAALGHDYSVEQSRVNPTCEATGSVTKKCSRCTATTTETLAALGHNYVATVTPPTCISQGYTTHVCSNDASHTYIDSYTPITEHTFVGGVCSHCGFSLATLIHFKANSEENTWAWQLIGGTGLGFDVSTDGAMYGTTNANSQSYFYVDPLANGNLDYEIESGDVIQIRIRVTEYEGSLTTVTPSVSLELASGTEYGATISGNTLDLTSEEWQYITIPIGSSYSVGEIVERIRINPFGTSKAAAKVEIDYIHFGTPDATPIEVTFYNYRGKVLQVSAVQSGSTVTYYGETPTKPSSAGFEYTFAGWYATGVDGTTSSLITDLSKVAFSQNTALTPGFTSVRVPTEPLDSNKYLLEDDNPDDYKFDIEIDASTYGQNVTINKEYKTPLDIVLVMDRSLSTTFHADFSKDKTFSSYNATTLNNYLDTLDKSKPEGYYTATNWLQCSYTGASDVYSGGFLSYEAMRYNSTKGYWEVWQTLTYSQAYTLAKTTIPGDTTKYADYVGKEYDQYTFLNPAGMMYNVYNWKRHNTIPGDVTGAWVPVTTACKNFFTRRDESYSTYGEPDDSVYPKANVLYRIGVSRLGLMQKALNDFIDEVYATTDQLPQGQYHRVSIVGYSYGAITAGRTANYSYRRRDKNGNFLNSSGTVVTEETSAELKTGSFTTTTAGDPGVTCSPIFLDSQADVNSIHNVINNPWAFGSTYTDDGLKLAKDHITAMNPKARNAQGVVVLFTDGCPTYGSIFIKETANNALAAAKAIKDTGTKLFTIGFMAGLNSATAPQVMSSLASTQEGKNANTFLHLASSNYPEASAMPESTAQLNAIAGNENAGYYYSTVDGAALAEHFAAIFTQTHTMQTVATQITGSLVVKDIVTREWDVVKENGTRAIKVQKCVYKGLGEFADAVDLDSSLYTLTVTENAAGETDIQVEWKDAPNAWLREAEEATNGYMGYKLLVTITIELDRDSTIGGNNIPTNSPDSGIFYPTNHDLDHKYEVPNVNVEMEYDHLPHDYFLDLYNDAAEFDYLDVLNNSGKKSEYLLSVYEDFYSRTVETIDGLNNRFVDIAHYVGTNNAYTTELAHGTTGWSTTFTEPTFDFITDIAGIPVSYKVTPITSAIDSLGRQPFAVKQPAQSARVNYYGPKYAVVDYGTDILVPMGNEIPDEMPITLGANGVFNNVNTKVMYTFRNDADSTTEAEHIMYGIEEIPYTVTAHNQPKSASSKQISRKIHIIPANTVEYDFDLLSAYEYVAGSGYTGEWTEDGTDNNLLQNCLNSERHGYDSTLVGASGNYSFGRSYVTTVSANIRTTDEKGNTTTEYHNNNALTFNFVGTGFDIISQTGPQEGTMVVEVYAVDAEGNVSGSVTKRYFVDNYLSTKNLYQLPVVHCTDLAYGEYKVVIRAFYNDAMNHYTVPNTASISTNHATKSVNVMTETKLRQILGLSRDDVLEYTLSETRGSAMRAMTATSYDVHVDGIRIYNTLGTLSASGTPVAYTLYGKEANAQFINARSILFDSKSWISKVDSSGNMTGSGMVYIAGNAIGNTFSSTTDGAVHLSMSGILKHEYVDGKYYILDSNNARVLHPDYGTAIYFKMADDKIVTVTNDGVTEPAYYCLDKSNKEVTIASQEFRKIIGSENIVFFNSVYDVAGPKNEIYLANNYGIAFNAKGATLLQLSMNSLDGSAVVLKAYDWSKNTFVDVSASTTNAATMYYDLSSYISSNGDVLISNNGSGIISISNVKVVGATITAPASTVVEAQRIMQMADVIQNSREYDENLTISTSITVGAEMQIGYTIKADKVASADDFYLEITKEVAGGDDIITIFTVGGENALEPLYNQTTGELVGYRALYTGISAKEMGDCFNAVLYLVTDGKTYYGADNTTSIKDFLLEKFESTTATDEFKTLAVDMLRYGAAAQLNFGYDVENLVDKDLTAQQLAYGTQTAPKAVDSSATTGDGLNLTTSVTVKSKVELTLTCMYATEDASNVKFVIKDSDGNVLAELAPSKHIANRAVQATYDNVGAKQMRELITIEIYDGDTLVSKTLTWSIESYVASVLAKESTTDVLANMVNAMLVYGDSAAVYLNGAK